MVDTRVVATQTIYSSTAFLREYIVGRHCKLFSVSGWPLEKTPNTNLSGPPYPQGRAPRAVANGQRGWTFTPNFSFLAAFIGKENLTAQTSNEKEEK